jgi:sodium-dependent dicarboxylate transporter 2/3/5
MGVAFAASIGGLGTLVGSPTNAIAAALVEKQLGIQISFLTWMLYGLPIVIVGVPLCAFILMRVQNVTAGSFDVDAARASIGKAQPMSVAEKRLLPILLLVIGLWISQQWLEPLLPKGGITDGSIAIAGSLLLFLIPDGTGRPLLTWQEADRAPWGFMMPSGTGPNAIAWASGHIALPKMVKAGFYLDLAGIPLIVGAVWLVGALAIL